MSHWKCVYCSGIPEYIWQGSTVCYKDMIRIRSSMPTNEYGQPTDSKGNVKKQSELIEAELEPMITTFTGYIQRNVGRPIGECFDDFKKDLAALVLKHRHDVYFQAYRDGLQQGRKEAQVIEDSHYNQCNICNHTVKSPEELRRHMTKEHKV